MSALFRGIFWNFCTLFQNFCVFILRFLAAPPTMICGTLLGKQWVLLIEISPFPPNKCRVTKKSFPEIMVFKTDILFSLKTVHLYRNMLEMNFMVTPCINNIQPFNYQLTHTTLKNVELLKYFKISKTAPTYFGLQGNYHQGATVST